MECGQLVSISKLEEGAIEGHARYMKTCSTKIHAFVPGLDHKIQNAINRVVEDVGTPKGQQGLGR